MEDEAISRHSPELGEENEPQNLRNDQELVEKQAENEREGCSEITNDVHTPAS